MFDTLKKFNFGKDLIHWVKLCYTDISSIVVNNGNFSEPFKIERGVRQGCPLSSSLFILCVEIILYYEIKNQYNLYGRTRRTKHTSK